MQIKGVELSDLIQVPTQRKFTDSGQMIVPCAFARTGSQRYLASQLGLQDEDPSKVIDVVREESEVFDSDSMESFRSVPVTIQHPTDHEGRSVSVTSINARELQVGVLEGVPTRDEDTLAGTLVIARQDAIDLIEEGTVELSAGYTCDLSIEDGVIYQRNIRANHIAIVERGRAGSSCRIADSAENIKEEQVEISELESIQKANEATAKVISDSLKNAGQRLAKHKSKKEGKKMADKKVELTDAEALVKVTAELADAKLKLEAVELSDELATQAAAAEAKFDALNEKFVALGDTFEDKVAAKVALLALAGKFMDTDFAGKSDLDIKKMCIADAMPNLDLADKADAYIEARFDILSEDVPSKSPMGTILADSVVVKTEVPKVSAREKMIAANAARFTS